MSEWYIAHSAGAWKKHKYIKKIGEGPKALYFYTQKQLGKWMKRKTENETTKKGLEPEGTENIETNDQRKKEQYFAKQRRRDYHDEKDRKEDLRRYAINNQTGDVERAKEAYIKGRNSQALLNGIRRNGRTYNDDRQEAYELGKQLMNDTLKKKAIKSQNSNHQEAAKKQAKEIKRSKAVNKQTGTAVAAQEKGKKAISKMRTSKGDGTVMKSTWTKTGAEAQERDRVRTVIKKHAQKGAQIFANNKKENYSYFKKSSFGIKDQIYKNKENKDRHSASSGSDYVKPTDVKRINEKLNRSGGDVNALSDEEKKMFYKMTQRGK